MTLPPLTDEQRAAAAAKATAARARRAEVKAGLRDGSLALSDVLSACGDDPALLRMRVVDLLRALPGIGPARADDAMSRLGIAPSRRLRGLGAHQATALVTEFG